MEKIKHILSSFLLMGLLLLVLAFSMGVATFIENDFGTNAAKALIYNAWWFEGLFLLLGINMVLNLVKPSLWKRGKLPVLFFHFSFLLIIIGAALTRYIGFEGTMHIREGESSDEFISQQEYIDGFIEKDGEKVMISSPVFLSEKSKNYFHKTIGVRGGSVELSSIDYIPDAAFRVESSVDGKPLITLVVGNSKVLSNLDLYYGEKVNVDSVWIGFGSDSLVDYQFLQQGADILLKTKESMFVGNMKTGERKQIAKNSSYSINRGVLYGHDDLMFVLKQQYEKAQTVPFHSNVNGSPSGVDAVKIHVNIKDEAHDLYLYGQKDSPGTYDSLLVEGYKVKLRYGSLMLHVPFSIYLKDFQMERYPGSESPSSFASEVRLEDKQRNVQKDFRIYMNHILNYRGYRFYQSSYDRDEKGTILMVNNDLLGTMVTYIGYLLLSVFMIAALFAKKSRFVYLSHKIKELGDRRKTFVLLLFVLFSTGAFSQHVDVQDAIVVNKEQADAFGKIWVQDNQGRIKPMNTLTSEILRKIVKFNTFKGYSSDRVVLSMLVDKDQWERVPLITVKDSKLKQMLQIQGKKAAYADFFDDKGNYKIHQMVEDAYRTRPAYRNKEQNDLVKIDEQVNVIYLVLSRNLLHIYPIKDHLQSKWLIPGGSLVGMAQEDSLFVSSFFDQYIHSLRSGKEDKALNLLNDIKIYQKSNAERLLPSEFELKTEIFYNKSNLFLFLAPILFFIGIVYLIIFFILLFQDLKASRFLYTSGKIVIVSCFIAYSVFLILRAYISGHAPWSDGYESMLYIGYVILIAGIYLGMRSPIIIPIASLFSGIVLFVAHLSWMNPEITPLVPVLKSYWLTIHVAVIVASYGFLGLGSLIAFFNLILMALQKNQGDEKVLLTIRQLSMVVEMGLTIGVYLLTIGAFLGGVWANESWGRYWGWDPKETWSMVTVITFVFILHMRFIPRLKGLVSFNIAAVIGFFSVIMTYLGVNYYLAGLHSYAKGDAVPIPGYVIYIIVSVVIVSSYAVFNQWRIKKVGLGR